MSTLLSTADLLAIADWLVDQGLFITIEDALAVAPYWQTQAYASWESYAGSVSLLSGGPTTSVVSTTQTALELATTTPTGAAPLTVKQTGLALADYSGGGVTQYGFKALMGVDLGIAAAALAPLLGVSLGAGLYAGNPELWTKISQKLLPFCYDDTTTIPTWADIADAAWRGSIAKEVLDALKELFDEEGIGGTTTVPAQTIDGYNIPEIVDIIDYTPFPVHPANAPSWSPLSFVTTSGPSCKYLVNVRYYGNQEYIIGIFTGASSGNIKWANGYTYSGYNTQTYKRDGMIAYWATLVSSNISSYTYDIQLTLNDVGNVPIGLIVWLILYASETGGYPAGTSQWQGTTYPEIPMSQPIVTGPTGTTIQTVPFSPPLDIPPDWKPGQPAPTGDPEQQEDPTKIQDPGKQIQPYIMPFPVPWETPIPEPQPQPEPDPSQPAPPTDTLIDVLPPLPAPEGLSPTPLMPTTALPFASNVGLITVYHPTAQELYDFERWLWVTYADATIDKIWNNPFDGVITLFELYCTPTDIGNRNIHCGFLDSGINSPVISRYTEINCGTLTIPEWYGDYMDYSPYTKAHVYLPFIGIQELNADDIVGHAVNITYRIDEYNGACIAMITVAKVTDVNGETVEYSNTMYQFSGNCSVELPLAGGSQASIKAGMMTADAYQQAAMISATGQLIGGIGSALLGSIGGAISGIGGAMSTYAYGQAQALSHMLSGKSTVQKSGAFGASHGALGIKTPYITVTRPKEIRVLDYNKLYGYPAHKMVIVGSCKGYLRCREVHVVSATATDEEKTMIEQLLKSGVYVTDESN